MAVQLKILYGGDRCKVQTVDKKGLYYLSFEDFEAVVRKTVGGFMAGAESNARIQYRDDEGTFVTMKNDFDLKDAIRCVVPVYQIQRKCSECV